MPISYNINIPQATDQISVSQAQILTNFQGINIWTGVDHYDFADALSGHHKQAYFGNNIAPTAPTVTDFVLYNQLDPANPGTIPQLYYKNSLFSVPMTSAALAVSPQSIPVAAGAVVSAGWTWLPSGLIVKWGIAVTQNSPTPGTVVIDLNTIGPSYVGNVLMAQATVNSSSPAFTTAVLNASSANGGQLRVQAFTTSYVASPPGITQTATALVNFYFMTLGSGV